VKDQHQIILILTIILGMAIISAGCTQQPVGPAGVTPTPTATTPAVTTPAAGIPNPAAVYCASKNYSYEIRKNPDGSEYGVCILPDGKECDSWAYFRNECNETTAK
jgi:putative hemolysin